MTVKDSQCLLKYNYCCINVDWLDMICYDSVQTNTSNIIYTNFIRPVSPVRTATETSPNTQIDQAQSLPAAKKGNLKMGKNKNWYTAISFILISELGIFVLLSLHSWSNPRVSVKLFQIIKHSKIKHIFNISKCLKDEILNTVAFNPAKIFWKIKHFIW